MKITRRQLRQLIREAVTDFVYPTSNEPGVARPPAHSAFSKEDQMAANMSYNSNSSEIDAIVPDDSGLNNVHPQSGRSFSVEAYTDAYQQATDMSANLGLSDSEVLSQLRAEMSNIDDEYGVESSGDEEVFMRIVQLGAEHALGG